jgi:hypothetical protein
MANGGIRFRTCIFTVTALVAVLLYAAPARAAGGDYVFDGGGPNARAEVKAALDASRFPWDVVPVEITIHIRRDIAPHATPGDIWLPRGLLRAGKFAWGIVQHEYAHQVGYFLVGLDERFRLIRRLRGRAWCHERPGIPHHAHACERFAHILTWAYWPSRHNVARPDVSALAASEARRFVARVVAS